MTRNEVHTLFHTYDGKYVYNGINMGGKATLVSEADNILVIKWPGHTYYSNVLEPKVYYSPKIQVLQLESKWKKVGEESVQHLFGSKKSVLAKLLIEWEVTRKKS